jgi:exoribonuclease R
MSIDPEGCVDVDDALSLHYLPPLTPNGPPAIEVSGK